MGRSSTEAPPSKKTFRTSPMSSWPSSRDKTTGLEVPFRDEKISRKKRKIGDRLSRSYTLTSQDTVKGSTATRRSARVNVSRLPSKI